MKTALLSRRHDITSSCSKCYVTSSILQSFDALVKPIALYNCEIWSAYKPCLRGTTVEEMFELTLKNTNEFEKNIYEA